MPRIALLLLLAAPLFAPLSAQIQGKNGITLPPPPLVAKIPVTDTYSSNGTPVQVTDNYRYLEDAKATDTRAYIADENAYTQQYLDQLKSLPATRTQMAALLKVDFVSTPQRRGNDFYFAKRLASENQASLYVRHGLDGDDTRLVDANTLSADQNTSVNIVDLTEDATLLAYGIRVGGADEQEIHFLNLRANALGPAGKDTPDILPSARYYGVQVAPNGKGVYYSKFFPHEGTRVFYHAFGAPVAADPMLFGGVYKGEKIGEIDGVGVRVTPNGHFLVLSIGRGVPARREDILIKDLRGTDVQVKNAPIVPLVYGIDSRFREFTLGDTFYVDTDLNAPNHRILKAIPGQPPTQWPTVIPEGPDVIESVSLVDRRFYVLRLHDVASQLSIYTLDGKPAGSIAYPGVGAGSGLSGRAEERDGFYTFQSIITPPTTYLYDTAKGTSVVFNATKSVFNPADYDLKEVFYTSKDGTRVPMFIAGKKGLPRDGSARLLMTGYGGFALSETPVWNPEYAWWMQQGGYFALPDLRGGNEYGEKWHQAAMFERKQNVFDDWYAAAEYLDKEKYTSPAHFAIRGRSNGGLLMGASMTQRPELWGAIWCGYPLLDMLRYQNFLMGRTWTTEYGNAENPADFPYIYKYSPYQHVVAGTKYPAILFFTATAIPASIP